jgi:hypothetical protein
MGNPRQSSLFTGKGTPWGPMDSGAPDSPNFITDPSQVAGFDYSPMRKQLAERMGMQGQEAAGQYLANQSKLMGGVARSSGAGTGLAQIATDTERNKGMMDAELAMQDWQQRMAMMNALNALKQSKYQTDMGAFQNEQAGRAGFLGDALGLAATGAGAYFGGKKKG